MKRVVACLLAVVLAAPALAQQGATEIEVEGRHLINQWIAAFNTGNTAAMLKDVYAKGDAAALNKQFDALRGDSFGKLDIYDAAFCGSDATHGKALLKYGKLFTYGGLMDWDEATVFELVKTEAGWRVGDETRVAYDTVLSCS
jgi:hypothetical protein